LFYVPLVRLYHYNFFFKLAGHLYFLTSNRMSLVTPPSSNGWTIPLSQLSKEVLLFLFYWFFALCTTVPLYSTTVCCALCAWTSGECLILFVHISSYHLSPSLKKTAHIRPAARILWESIPGPASANSQLKILFFQLLKEDI
jgi:hypothetical protein